MGLSVTHVRMVVLSRYSDEFVSASWNVGFIWMLWQVFQFLMEGWRFYLGTLVSLSLTRGMLVLSGWSGKLVSFLWKVGVFIWVLW